MKPLFLISTLFLFVFISCDHTVRSNKQKAQKAEPPKAETPKALQGEASDISFSKRGSDNLVESIYEELVDKRPGLKEIENQIKNINDSKNDSTGYFKTYDNKNSTYYLSAGSLLNDIKDSVLKNRIKLLLNNSQAAYNDKIAKHKDLLSVAGAKDEALADAHAALKVLQTLPVIEYYQKNSLPAIASIQGLINEYDKLLKKIDKMPN